MTKKETVNRNIGLAFDFLKAMNSNPKILTEIKKGVTIDFIEKDFPKKEATSAHSSRKKYVKVKNEFEII